MMTPRPGDAQQGAPLAPSAYTTLRVVNPGVRTHKCPAVFRADGRAPVGGRDHGRHARTGVSMEVPESPARCQPASRCGPFWRVTCSCDETGGFACGSSCHVPLAGSSMRAARTRRYQPLGTSRSPATGPPGGQLDGNGPYKAKARAQYMAPWPALRGEVTPVAGPLLGPP